MPAEQTEAIRGAGRAGCGSREEQAFLPAASLPVIQQPPRTD